MGGRPEEKIEKKESRSKKKDNAHNLLDERVEAKWVGLLVRYTILIDKSSRQRYVGWDIVKGQPRAKVGSGNKISRASLIIIISIIIIIIISFIITVHHHQQGNKKAVHVPNEFKGNKMERF